MLKLICILIFVIPSIAVASARAPSQSELKSISNIVINRLKDPDSAKITEVRIADDGHVCGFVNAKNSYGGYVGKKPFIGVISSKSNKHIFGLVAIAESSFDESYILDLCLKKMK